MNYNPRKPYKCHKCGTRFANYYEWSNHKNRGC